MAPHLPALGALIGRSLAAAGGIIGAAANALMLIGYAILRMELSESSRA